MSAADEVQYHCYTPETIPCPNCTMCKEHAYRAPRITVRRRYWRVMKDGTRVEMTRVEYANRLK
jgi:hypothetical protein